MVGWNRSVTLHLLSGNLQFTSSIANSIEIFKLVILNIANINISVMEKQISMMNFLNSRSVLIKLVLAQHTYIRTDTWIYFECLSSNKLCQ